jgi:hypothetical protein
MHLPKEWMTLGACPSGTWTEAHDVSATRSCREGLPPLAGVIYPACAQLSKACNNSMQAGPTSSEGCSKVACRKMGLRTLSDMSGLGSVAGSAPGYLPPRAIHERKAPDNLY